MPQSRLMLGLSNWLGDTHCGRTVRLSLIRISVPQTVALQGPAAANFVTEHDSWNCIKVLRTAAQEISSDMRRAFPMPHICVSGQACPNILWEQCGQTSVRQKSRRQIALVASSSTNGKCRSTLRSLPFAGVYRRLAPRRGHNLHRREPSLVAIITSSNITTLSRFRLPIGQLAQQNLVQTLQAPDRGGQDIKFVP